MGSKKLRGRTCVYCAQRIGSTRDHVIARQFFPPAHRGNLPLAPACATCNTLKSGHERYLAEILPFGSSQPNAAEVLLSEGSRRMDSNDRLRRELAEGMEPWQVTDSSGTRQTIALPFDNSKLESLAALISRGLAFHHWNVTPGPDHSEHVMSLTQSGSDWYNQTVLGLRGKNRVRVDLGDGIFTYEGIQAADRDDISVWAFSFFGVVRLSCGNDEPDEISRLVAVISAPASALRKLGIL